MLSVELWMLGRTHCTFVWAKTYYRWCSQGYRALWWCSVYTGDRSELLATLTDMFWINGVLCAMYRPVFLECGRGLPECPDAIVIDGVVIVPMGSYFPVQRQLLWIDAVFCWLQFLWSIESSRVRVSIFWSFDYLGYDGWYDSWFEMVGIQDRRHGTDGKFISIDHPSLAAEPGWLLWWVLKERGFSRNNCRSRLCGPHPMAHGGIHLMAAAARSFWQLRAPETNWKTD